MATRLLLTLLALLTGLAAQLNSAQARECAAVDAEVGALALASGAQRQVAPVSPKRDADEQRSRAAGEPGVHLAAGATVAIPTVRQGIDRARE